MKKRICFIAQFPPPIHGLSKAVDTLYNSELKNEFVFEKVDITNNKKIIKNIISIIKSKADLFYFTISQTKGGNLRDLIILKLLKRVNKKCLVHLHGGYYRTLVDNDLPKWQKKANYKAMQEVEGAIVLGKSLKHIFKGMIDEKRIYVVPNCIDDQYLLTENEIKAKLEKVQKKQIKDVLYLSNFIKEKGYQYVLELAKLEKEELDKTGKRKYHFNFAGKFFDNKIKEEFFDFINKNNLDDFITYHGVVDGNKKRQLLKEANIFILLTTYPKEGQPISILEAMGNGIAVITTNHAGIPDIVKDKENGIVVDKNKIDLKDLYYKKIENIELQSVLLNNYNAVKEYSQLNYISNMKKIINNMK